MPFIANTPESILPRSDSLNPATTCRGITVNGRPCRRPLTSPAPSSKGNVAGGSDPAAFYCWQHKDQAEQFVGNTQKKGRADNQPIKERTSIDTLVERLGVLDVNDEKGRTKPRQDGAKRHGPNGTNGKSQPHGRSSQAGRAGKTIFCCFRIADADDLPASKPVARPVDDQHKRGSTAPSASQQRPVIIRKPHSPQRAQIIQQRPVPTTPPKQGHSATPTRPSQPATPASSTSQTQPLLSWIPPHLSPQTTANLLTELAKPISEADEEGYIYIFWITPSTSNSTAPPPSDIASNLLPSPNRPGHHRRTSDALRAVQSHYADNRGSGSSPGTIRLKIGRTSNVYRRMNEWTRQCSYNLTLIRYYPYSPSSSSPSPSPARRPESHSSQEPGRRVPHVHRVERLIHIELADHRVKGQGPCPECGKEHREWFEFEATKDALRLVDECVRRWVSWAETH